MTKEISEREIIMRIQPNYIQVKYSQPSFKAAISSDDGTNKVLNHALGTQNTNSDADIRPEYLYCLYENLKRIKSEDEIQIHEICTKGLIWTDGTEKQYQITNTRTGATIRFKEISKNGNVSYSAFGDWGSKEFKSSENLAHALYNAITNDNSLYKLFGRKGAKKKSEFLTPGQEILDSKINNLSKVRNQLNSTNEQIASLKTNLDKLNNVKNRYQQNYNKMRQEYVANELNIQI